MNVVDSSGWLEYFADGRNAGFFAPAIEDTRRLVVPTLCLFEVYRRVAQQRDEAAALNAAALMRQGRIAALDTRLALAAANLSLSERLPTADSIVLATARASGAILWTQDADFEGKAGVRFVAARR
jgi:predicted nucleic acid-binding protein